MHPSVAVFVFLLTIAAVLGTGNIVYKSNCFYEDAKDTCRSKTVDIGGRLYGCEDVIDFENEIVKIEFFGEPNQQTAQIILVQDSNDISYEIDEAAHIKKISQLLSTERCTLIVDKKLNTFKIELGKASVTGPKGILSRDIVTASGFIPKELALDPKTGMLFILAVKSNNRGVTDEGSVFAINVNNLNKNKVIQAQRISPRNVIFTGLSIYEGLDNLIVGIKTDGQYKYIKLAAVPKENPCFTRQKRSLAKEILTILEETNSEESERIAKLCSEYSETNLLENPLTAIQTDSRTFEIKGPRSNINESGCDDKLERQRKLLDKINTTFKPIITVRNGPDFAKNQKELDDFFYEVHEMLIE